MAGKALERLIVVGGGIAGVGAAQAARREYPHSQIILYSAEPHPFYNKIALNAFMTGKREQRHLQFYETNWLSNQRIEARYGQRVKFIERQAHAIHFDDGRSEDYDRLVIATGARPILPPFLGVDSPRVFSLWSLGDALRLRQEVRRASSVSIIGAGLLGVEAAVDLASVGKKVMLFDCKDRVLPLHLGEKPARLYERYLQSCGIGLRLGVQVTAIETRASGAFLRDENDETTAAEVVLLMAGVLSETALAREAGLACGRGILVDEYMMTADPHILACGNCAQPAVGTVLLWNAALGQAELAGLNAFERKRPYRPRPLAVYAKTPHMPLFVCGEELMATTGGRVIEEEISGKYRAIRLGEDRRIRAALLLGDIAGAYYIEHAMQTGQAIPPGLGTVADILAFLIPEIGPLEVRGKAWVCQMCGYTHEGDDPPHICPICAVGQDQFLAA